MRQVQMESKLAGGPSPHLVFTMATWWPYSPGKIDHNYPLVGVVSALGQPKRLQDSGLLSQKLENDPYPPYKSCHISKIAVIYFQLRCNLCLFPYLLQFSSCRHAIIWYRQKVTLHTANMSKMNSSSAVEDVPVVIPTFPCWVLIAALVTNGVTPRFHPGHNEQQ